LSRKRESAAHAAAGVKEAEALTASAVARDFSCLAGYQGIQERLTSLRSSSALPPVLMFVGREGLGKRRLAAFAAALYACASSSSCGHCPQCRELIAGRNPEILWIEPSDGPLKNEQVSMLQEHLSYSAGRASSGARIAVIIDADRMTEQASNRLLKTLEEPAESARIILTTSRPGALLPTILSRVVRWNVPPPERAAALQVLKKLVDPVTSDRSDVKLDPKLNEALDRSGGSPGRAYKILGDAEAHAAAGEAVRRFLEEEDASVQLRLAEEFARIFGWTAIQLADMCEWEMNKIYRREMSSKMDVPDLARLHDRRAMLSRVRWLAGRRQINLNTQLMAEGLAMGGKVI